MRAFAIAALVPLALAPAAAAVGIDNPRPRLSAILETNVVATCEPHPTGGLATVAWYSPDVDTIYVRPGVSQAVRRFTHDRRGVNPDETALAIHILAHETGHALWGLDEDGANDYAARRYRGLARDLGFRRPRARELEQLTYMLFVNPEPVLERIGEECR